MFSFAFVQASKYIINAYEDFPLPAFICDLDFRAYWSNSAARRTLPETSSTEGLHLLLEEVGRERIKQALKEQESFQVSGLFPFTNQEVFILPITPSYAQQEDILGYFIQVIGNHSPGQRMADFQGATGESLTYKLREIVQNLFSASDTLAIKSDLLGSHWIDSYLNDVGLQAYDLLRLSSNISTYTRLQNRQIPPKFAAFDVTEWLKDIQSSTQALAQEAGAEIEFQLPEKTLFIAADIDLFKIAFFNVLHNSLYYSPPANRISIRLSPLNDGIKISISDQGMGIPPDVLPLIFIPYFSFAPNGRQPSVGLGLTLARRIAELHKGALDIQSQQGQGTTATFTLASNLFLAQLDLQQGDAHLDAQDRYSPLYTGLTSSLLSPYHTNNDTE